MTVLVAQVVKYSSIILLYYLFLIELIHQKFVLVVVVVKHTKKNTILIIFNVQFNNIKYIHNVVQLSPSIISRTFHHPKPKLHTC